MSGPVSARAPGQRPAALVEPHLVPLAGEWALWRDIAVRTAGFPASELDVFGQQDESAGLRAVARDPLFQTAQRGRQDRLPQPSRRPTYTVEVGLRDGR